MNMLAIYSFAHFLVDFSCAYFIFSRFLTLEHWVLCLVLYNFFAFAMQLPFGILADKLNRNSLCAAIGCVLTGLSFFLASQNILACVIVGTGNAFFHLGGGIDILNQSQEKSSRLGVFISPGAFGIYFGTMLSKKAALPGLAVVALLFLTAILISVVSKYKTKSFISANAAFSFPVLRNNRLWLIAIFFFIVVLLRSFAGNTMSFPWKANATYALLLTCGIVFGKTAGGFIADRFGALRSSLVTLVIAALLFPFADHPVVGIFAVFLFNMTMPVTLWAMARVFPGAKGFSFGALTLALFLGLVPVMLDSSLPGLSYYVFSLISLLSALLLYCGLKKDTLCS